LWTAASVVVGVAAGVGEGAGVVDPGGAGATPPGCGWFVCTAVSGVAPEGDATGSVPLAAGAGSVAQACPVPITRETNSPRSQGSSRKAYRRGRPSVPGFPAGNSADRSIA